MMMMMMMTAMLHRLGPQGWSVGPSLQLCPLAAAPRHGGAFRAFTRTRLENIIEMGVKSSYCRSNFISSFS